MTIHAADRKLSESESSAVHIVLLGLANDFVGRFFEDLELRAVAGRSSANEPLDRAQFSHRFAILHDLIEICGSNAGQDVLRELQLFLHPEAGWLAFVARILRGSSWQAPRDQQEAR